MKEKTKYLKNIILFLSIFFIYSGNIHAINLDDGRIDPFDGIEDFNSVVYVKVGNAVCSGAVINNRTILTAAHCLIEGEIAEIFVGNEINDDSLKIETTSFIRLPEDRRYALFNGASYDLALISLKEPLQNITPLSLNLTLPALNSEVYISGFGLHGTGSNPDQEFDSKKRWGTNKLSIISKESSIVGPSTLSNTPDKTILSISFDENISWLESLVSLGDSGGPLLLKENGSFTIIGITSWVSQSLDSQNRGYGASAGFSSIEQNAEWISLNNPLRAVTSTLDGAWSLNETWNDAFYPNNFSPSNENYNTISARYYSASINNSISLSDSIEIDQLNISDLGDLVLNKGSSLTVLMNTNILKGNITNNGTFLSSALFVNGGTYENEKTSSFIKQIEIKKGELVNNGDITAISIDLKEGIVSGTGNFITDRFTNEGSISPGSKINPIGTLTFSSLLENKGELLIDLNNKSESDFIEVNKFKINGTLSLNPLSTFYSGNTEIKIMSFNESEGENFTKLNILKPNFGRLNQKVIYSDKGIDLMLLNPNYENLGSSDRARRIGGHIDNFTANTSTNFQEVLDQINYLELDNELSFGIEGLVTSHDYKYFIERIESFDRDFQQGIFVSKSNYDMNSNQSKHESKINRLDINYYGLNLAYFKMEADLNSSVKQSYSDSDAQEISYRLPLSFIDVSLSSYIQDSRSKTSRGLLIGSSTFEGNSIKDFEIKKDSINFIKSFDTEIGSFGLGFSYSSINASTESFTEILNNTNNDYVLQDVNFNFYTPHFKYSKKLNFGLNAIKVGFSLKRPKYKKNSLKMNVSLDVSNEVLTLDEELGLSNDSSTTLFISNTYSKSLFAELSYSQKEDNKTTQLRFGYLF